MGNSVKFKYVFNEEYNPVYVNGAQGGINPQGEIIVNFYLERLALPISQSQDLKEDGTLSDTVVSEPKDLNSSYVRFVQKGVIMNLQVAKSIHSWLGKHIEKLEQLQPGQK